MKKCTKLLMIAVVMMIGILVTGCGKKNYEEYIGYQFSGKDPWDNEVAVTIRKIEDNKVTWTYTDVYGEGEEAITLYNELTSDMKDDKVNFTVKGDTDKEGVSFEYKGTLTLKDGKVILSYEDGQLTTKSTDGDSGSYHIGAVEEGKRIITLNKVVDNA